MIITINPTTRIDGSDGMNQTLQRKVVVGATGKASKRKGEERWDTLGHYATVEQACIAAMRKGVVADGEVTLEEAVRRIEAAAKQIAKAVRR